MFARKSHNADFAVLLCWTWCGCIHTRKTVEGLMSNLIASTLTHKHHLCNNNLARQWLDSLPCLCQQTFLSKHIVRKPYFDKYFTYYMSHKRKEKSHCKSERDSGTRSHGAGKVKSPRSRERNTRKPRTRDAASNTANSSSTVYFSTRDPRRKIRTLQHHLMAQDPLWTPFRSVDPHTMRTR